MLRFSILILTSAFLTSAPAADLKFAVVDMSKAFSEFQKTQEAADKFKGNVEKAQKEMNDRWAVYKGLMDTMQKLKKEISDPISSPDVRNKKAGEFEEKAREARALEQEITEAQNRRTNQLKQEDVEIRRDLYAEIVAVVRDHAKAQGFAFVFDKTGASLSTVPVLLYYKDAADITDQVIVELNKKRDAAPAADAPAGAAAGKP